MSGFDHDVVIVGSGPAGIGAATALAEAGVKDVVVLERETEIGGIPRHTHHPSFGLLVFKRPVSGPKYVRALLDRCPQTRFETRSTVTALLGSGRLEVATPAGINTIRAKHIILATGARETPRHGRLVSGLRPQGITTTGALQQFIYGAKIRPFQRPVVVGTELVSFSALWTLKSAGIKPVAMIEENSRITAYRPASTFARLLGVPIQYNTTISDISAVAETQEIVLETKDGRRAPLACDGVIFSGKFVGDNNLARTSHLEVNSQTQLPFVDQNWLSSDPHISVIGNTVHPADMGDRCYLEGMDAGRWIARNLGEDPRPSLQVNITHGAGIKMTAPSFVRLKSEGDTIINISLHVTEAYTGPVSVKLGERGIYRKTKRCKPARRITLKRISIGNPASSDVQDIHVRLENLGN